MYFLFKTTDALSIGYYDCTQQSHAPICHIPCLSASHLRMKRIKDEAQAIFNALEKEDYRRSGLTTGNWRGEIGLHREPRVFPFPSLAVFSRWFKALSARHPPVINLLLPNADPLRWNSNLVAFIPSSILRKNDSMTD